MCYVRKLISFVTKRFLVEFKVGVRIELPIENVKIYIYEYVFRGEDSKYCYKVTSY